MTRWFLPLLAIAFLITGCGPGEGIRTYTVPKPIEPKLASAKSGPSGVGQRLLGAIIPRQSASWYFKLSGPTPIIASEYDAFVKFITTITFQSVTDAEGNAVSLPRWQLPQGWRQQEGTGMRFATITLGPAVHAQELTVFRFPGESGSIMSNIERWAGQIGLTNQTPQQIADMQRSITVDGQPAILVDISGPGGDGSGMGPARPPFANRPQTPPPMPKLTYEVPEGWDKQPLEPESMRLAAWAITEGDKKAVVTIIPLPNQGGQPADPVANLNRWRDQVGLPPVDRDDYRKDLETEDETQRKYLTVIMVGGDHALYADYIGPPENGDRVMGVMQPVGGYTFFYKLMGPADLVAKNKEAFGMFLKSLRYEDPQ